MTEQIEPELDPITELATILYNFPTSIRSIKVNIQSFLLANHYVKLSDDQTSPELSGTHLDIQNHLLEAGWKKVELER